MKPSLRNFLPEPVTRREPAEPLPEPPPVVWPPPELAWCPAPPPCLHGQPPKIRLCRTDFTITCAMGARCLLGGAGEYTYERAIAQWIWLLAYYRGFIPCPCETHAHPFYAEHSHHCPLCRGDQMIRVEPDGSITTPFDLYMAENSDS